MVVLHSVIVDGKVHVIGYIQDADPGAIGPGMAWIDTTNGPGLWVLNFRNAADDGWEAFDLSLYLPLTAGSGKPLTGDLYVDKTEPSLLLRYNGDSTTYTEIKEDSIASYINGVSTGGKLIFVNPKPESSSAAEIGFFRTTNTSNTRLFNVYLGNNTSTVQHTLNAGTGDVDLCQQGGELTVGDATNKILIDPVNGIYLYGSATVWDDLRFPATRLQVNPATLKPDFDFTNVGLLFDAASTETVYCIAQMPHSWKIGSDIKPHIHWLPTNTDTGNVYWRMEYKWTNVGDTTAGSFTTLNLLTAADGTSGKHQIAAFAAISGAGKTLSSVLSVKLSRIGGDGTDTYNADALMKEFDIHVELDSMGSDDEYVKGP